MTDESAAVRRRIRLGEWTGPTAGLAPGFAQANLVVVSDALADDFETFCRRNPHALPLLERTPSGSPIPTALAPTADLRTDLPRYRLYRDGRLLEEPTDIVTLWRRDSVAFLIGCSFSFDALLREHGIRVRHLDVGCNVPMYETNRPARPAGPFAGPLVVSMRPLRAADVDRVVELTSELPDAHGGPIHVGPPVELGITDLAFPDYGDPVPIDSGEVPAFWACGVTALASAVHGRISRMITHAPGHMFVTDRRVDPTVSRTEERK